jgi:hypothetical protein
LKAGTIDKPLLIPGMRRWGDSPEGKGSQVKWGFGGFVYLNDFLGNKEEKEK